MKHFILTLGWNHILLCANCSLVGNKNIETQELGIVLMAYLFLGSGQTQAYSVASVFSYLTTAIL